MNSAARRLAVQAVGLVLGVNAVVLGGAAYNRSGEPEASLRLTERELRKPMTYMGDGDEDSGRSLVVQWRVPERNPDAAYRGPRAEWLDRSQLQALGFSPEALEHDPARPGRVRPSRQAWVVLELAGDAHAAAVAAAQATVESTAASATASTATKADRERAADALEGLERERSQASRLFAVAADMDAAALRARYPDRTRHLIVRASIEIGFDATGSGPPRPYGYIDRLHLADLHVPREHHALVDAAAQGPYDASPPRAGFEVLVRFGRRGEPWIAELQPRNPAVSAP